MDSGTILIASGLSKEASSLVSSLSSDLRMSVRFRLLSGSIDGWQQLNIGSGFCALSARAIRESRLSESIVEESQPAASLCGNAFHDLQLFPTSSFSTRHLGEPAG
uniref:Uncharacterized protein n=1 Tax=Nelumbo nucifera TaxID=4432 RepID=A0A822ZEC7_NELNU|nr:TPA_asm: hypothetical protein HUJ06_000321 [Nelumbo nucifera]